MKENRFLIDSDIEYYCEQHTDSENDVLKRLTRETNLTTLMPRMLSGKIQGRFLAMLVAMRRPKNILELGTFTGYSALCLAEGLPEDGVLTTVDKNPEIEDIARKYFKLSGLSHKINFIIGDAFEFISTTNMMFEMIFMDADKERLPEYFEYIIEKVIPGGIVIVDNVLWDGKVIDPEQDDRTTRKIRDFNDLIQADDRIKNIMLPLRDGLMIIQKK